MLGLFVTSNFLHLSYLQTISEAVGLHTFFFSIQITTFELIIDQLTKYHYCKFKNGKIVKKLNLKYGSIDGATSSVRGVSRDVPS